MGLSCFNALLKRSVKPAIRVFSSFCACSYKMVGHFQALRIGFFVQELELTAEESIEFWPAWNELEEQMKGHRELIRDLERRISGASTDDEARQLAAEMKAMKIQGLDLQDAGLEQMSEVIGYRRAAQIEQIERAFRSRLLKKRMNGRNAGDPGPKRKF